MKKYFFSPFLFIFSCLFSFNNFATDMKPTEKSLALNFNQTEYFHRWSKDTQHEFTPAGQEDLSRWNDMLTLNYYPTATTGEGLADIANRVLSNYQNSGATILHTDSLPRTESKAAEHLIVAAFIEANQVEFAAARFVLTKTMGASIIYSHRIYGKDARNVMNEWIKANGEKIETTLMQWNSLPDASVFEKKK